MGANKKYVFKSVNFGTYKVQRAPKGYDSASRVFERSERYHSMRHQYSERLTFYFDGAEYLRRAYNEGAGSEEVVLCDVYEQDEQDGTYSITFPCRVNLTKYKETKDGGVSVNFEQLDKTQQLFNSEDIKVNIFSPEAVDNGQPLPPLEVHELTLTANVLVRRTTAKTTIITGEDSGTRTRDRGNEGERTAFLDYKWDAYPDVVPMYFLPHVHEVNPNQIKTYNTFPTQLVNELELGSITDADKEIFIAEEDGEYTYSCNYDFQHITEHYGARELKCQWSYRHYQEGEEPTGFSLGPLHETSWNSNRRQNYANLNYTGSFEVSLNVKKGDIIYFFFNVVSLGMAKRLATAARFYNRVTINAFTFNIQAATTAESSTAQGVLIGDALKRTVESLLGTTNIMKAEPYDVAGGYQSETLGDREWGRRVLLNGAHIRGNKMEDRPLYCTLGELFDTLNAIDNIGLGTRLNAAGESEVFVAPIEDFYPSGDAINIGCVTDYEMDVDTNGIFNKTKIGYEKYESEGEYSTEEINTVREHKLPITQVKNSYERLAPYRADGKGLEELRRAALAPDADLTKTDSSDDENWVVVVSRNGESGWKNESGSEVILESTGLIAPSGVMNIRISPGRMVRRHLPMISGCMEKLPDRLMRFTYGEINYKAFTRLSSEGQLGGVAEDQHYKSRYDLFADYPALPAPLLLPEIYSFKKLLTVSQIKAIRANPLLPIIFHKGDGVEKCGHILKLDMKADKVGIFSLRRKFMPSDDRTPDPNN